MGSVYFSQFNNKEFLVSSTFLSSLSHMPRILIPKNSKNDKMGTSHTYTLQSQNSNTNTTTTDITVNSGFCVHVWFFLFLGYILLKMCKLQCFKVT